MGRHIKFDMKKILVTGSKGLIGKKVIINLKKKYKVEGIDIKDGLDLNNEYWYNWEFYAYRSPLWKSRFDKYKIHIDDKEKKIVF